MERIGRCIQAKRQKLRWNQKKLAQVVGVDPTYVSYVESLKTLPSEERARRFARVLEEDEEKYVRMLSDERFIHRARRKMIETTDTVEISLMGYFLEQAIECFDFVIYSGASWIIEFSARAREALRRGVRIRIVMAAPSARNSFRRTEGRFRDQSEIEVLVHRMQLQQLRIWTSLWYFKEIWREQTDKTLFHVRLSPSYKSERIVIIDNKTCFKRPDWSKKDFEADHWLSVAELVRGGGADLQEQQDNLQGIWDHSEPVDWNDKNLFTGRIKLVSKAEVQKLLREDREHPERGEE